MDLIDISDLRVLGHPLTGNTCFYTLNLPFSLFPAWNLHFTYEAHVTVFFFKKGLKCAIYKVINSKRISCAKHV